MEATDTSAGSVSDIDTNDCSNICRDTKSLCQSQDTIQGPSNSLSTVGKHSSSSVVTHQDMSTWTAEDDMSSPTESLSLDSPINFRHTQNIRLPNLNLMDSKLSHSHNSVVYANDNSSNIDNASELKRVQSYNQRHNNLLNQSLIECSAVSPQLLYRQTQFYANVPNEEINKRNPGIGTGTGTVPSQSQLENTTNSLIGVDQHWGKQAMDNSAFSNQNEANQLMLINNPTKLRSVPDLLGVIACPSSSASWVDGHGGRDNVNFEAEGGNLSSNLCKTQMSFLGTNTSSHCAESKPNYVKEKKERKQHYNLLTSQSPFHMPVPVNTEYFCDSGIDSDINKCIVNKYSKRDKHLKPMQATEFVHVPDRDRDAQISDLVDCLHSEVRHFNEHPRLVNQLLMEGNNTNHALQSHRSPYIIPMSNNDWQYRFNQNRNKAAGITSSNMGDLYDYGKGVKYPRRSFLNPRGKNKSFDYGELPSHQMFPRKYLLTPGMQPLSNQKYPGVVGTNDPDINGANDLNGQKMTTSTHQSSKPEQLAPTKHRSFPAGMISCAATTRSCSMGDLTSGKSVNSVANIHDRVVAPPVNPNVFPSPLAAASLPLPPATSVTYEFSLAPVSGTLAPGWHLTAVQRGLATAVPLAAVVARRRLLRPRPATRHRIGFTDKNEARRAKCTIVITVLALLAMSMLLVGITLRLAPFIDDLVRKENENLLKGIHQPSPLNISSTNSISHQLHVEQNISFSHFNDSLYSADRLIRGRGLRKH